MAHPTQRAGDNVPQGCFKSRKLLGNINRLAGDQWLREVQSIPLIQRTQADAEDRIEYNDRDAEYEYDSRAET